MSGYKNTSKRHCEFRFWRDEAISTLTGATKDCFAALAITNLIFRPRLKKFNAAFLAGLFALSVGCKKDVVTDYVYEIDKVNVTQDGVNKPNVKSTTEFISIAYSDLYGSTIDQGTLTDLSFAYASFSDKKLLENLIIRNFLNAPGVSIPTTAQMNSNLNQFVIDTYKKFYNREPNEFELWQVKDLISKDSGMTPELVYYAFMTSNEYRYY